MMGEAPVPGPRKKHEVVADMVRALVEAGVLRPGEMAPAAVALSAVTGCSAYTCLRGLRLLAAEGLLTRGLSGSSRFRVAVPGLTAAERALAAAEDGLSAGLNAGRRANGMTQQDLAGLLGVCKTTVGHAETRRVWQARDFWERADAALGGDGGLLRLHDAYLRAKAAVAPKSPDLFGAPLTRREQEMAVRFAGGMTYEGIAGELRVSMKTVRVHMSRVHLKAGSGGSSHISRELLAVWLAERDRAVPAGAG
jgi:DNA-binding CsgD family transcriptional regulator